MFKFNNVSAFQCNALVNDLILLYISLYVLKSCTFNVLVSSIQLVEHWTRLLLQIKKKLEILKIFINYLFPYENASKQQNV